MTPKKTPLPPEGDNVQLEATTQAGLPTVAPVGAKAGPNVPRTAPERLVPSAKPSGKKILIVEDERPLAHALEMKFRNQGYETQIVMNGVEALAAVKVGGLNLVLLDLIMPVMDGFAVLAELKSQGNTIPVIVLSNLGQDEDRVKSKELGAIDYFVKSNTPIADIVSRVKSLL